MGSWHEDDAFWHAMYPVFFTPDHWARAAQEAHDVAALLGLAPGDAVLDLGCGPGRHALALAELGLAVTGLDRTEAYLVEARRRAAEANSPATFEAGDMRRLAYDARFDAVVCLSTSFGYFDDPADDRAVLRGVRAALKPGGGFVVHLLNLEAVRGTFEPDAAYALADGTRVTERRSPVGDDGLVAKTRTVTTPGAPPVTFDVTHRLYTPGRLAGLLEESGLRDIRCCSTLRGEPYDRSAKMLVAVARR